MLLNIESNLSTQMPVILIKVFQRDRTNKIFIYVEREIYGREFIRGIAPYGCGGWWVLNKLPWWNRNWTQGESLMWVAESSNIQGQKKKSFWACALLSSCPVLNALDAKSPLDLQFWLPKIYADITRQPLGLYNYTQLRTTVLYWNDTNYTLNQSYW